MRGPTTHYKRRREAVKEALMRLRLAALALSTSAFVLGCGSSESKTSSAAAGGGGGGAPAAHGDSCSAPIVLTDHWMGTHDFTEPFSWGSGTATSCADQQSRPAVFLRWTADGTDSSSFKVLVDGSESVTLEIFEGESCDGTPKVCTDQKIAVGAPHVAGSYVPVVDGQPISVVVVSKESRAPSGDWTIWMGD